MLEIDRIFGERMDYRPVFLYEIQLVNLDSQPIEKNEILLYLTPYSKAGSIPHGEICGRIIVDRGGRSPIPGFAFRGRKSIGLGGGAGEEAWGR
jgi:hypothetical protein